MKAIHLLLVTLVSLTAALPQASAENLTKTNAAAYNLDSSKVAIQGYDPVAYFTQGAAVKGSAANSTTHEGVTYHVSSAANRDAFAASPVKYLPAYGGWCATAMAKEQKVAIDPKNFKVTDGRLFLFFNAWYGDARKTWLKDEAGQTVKADSAWTKISGEK
jgi:YHS domain-containing protein